MSIIKRFSLLLCLLLALTTGAAAAGTITDLRTDCLVAGNGSCQVTQTVTIEFTGIEQSLTIPLGANAKRASIAGYRAQKTVEDGYTLFQLKDDAGFAGSRTFTVTYTLSGLVTETDGEQTLNLPLLCPKWDYPIEHFSFTVTMPKDIETVPGFSSGYYGDVIEDYMTAARQGAVLLGDLDTALKDHESLTMTLALGPRYFTGTYSGWSANWVAAAFCILFALLALGYWFLTLRSPRLSVSSRSLPPDSALPCDLPFLLAGAKPDFNMLLCHWASLGYLSIAVDPQGHVSLLRHMYMGNERRGLECKLFAALFARADRCDGASIHYKNTAKSAAGALARFWGRRLYERGSGNVLVMRALAALCSGVALLSAASFLLPVLLPFLIGLLAALLAQRPIALCTNRLHAPRTLAAFFCTLLLFALLGSALFFLGRVLFGELSGFLREIPSLLSSISVPLASIKLRLYALAGRLPDGLGTGLRASLDQFFQSSGAFGARAYEWLFHQASSFLSHLPGVVLFAVAAIVSSFMLAAQLPQLRRSFAAHLPQLARGKLASALGHIRAALGWLLAQLKLMGVTFLILTAGFLLLRTEYPLLFALLTTLIDALPVFGTGTVLIPWALLEFLHGNTACGVGFLILYAVAALTRQTLEPRLVGQQIGLAPIFTLLALYAGYKTIGVPGMILFPICAVLFRQLWDHSGLQNS